MGTIAVALSIALVLCMMPIGIIGWWMLWDSVRIMYQKWKDK